MKILGLKNTTENTSLRMKGTKEKVSEMEDTILEITQHRATKSD